VRIGCRTRATTGSSCHLGAHIDRRAFVRPALCQVRRSLPVRAVGEERAPASVEPGSDGDAVRASFAEVGNVCAVLGTQWGDEGKGKLVDAMAQHFNVVARAQGGANAGHTIYGADGTKFALHLMPCGILNPEARCVIGNGCAVHVPTVLGEIDALEAKGIAVGPERLAISDRAHVLLDLHKMIDGLREAELADLPTGDGPIGTTKRGIGPCYSAKATRNGIRVSDLIAPDGGAKFEAKLKTLVADAARRFGSESFACDVAAEAASYRDHAARLRPYVKDTVSLMAASCGANDRVLIEGANATMLDIDFGTYPFVTSSSTTIGGVCAGLGVPPQRVTSVVGVAKAYTTRVGEGPYPTEVFGELAERIRKEGGEFGTTTGRPRRCGWLDAVALRYACAINGFALLNITKLDVLSGLDQVMIGTGYRGANGSGEALASFPADLDVLGEVAVEYETLPGWKEDISKCRAFGDLPRNAQAYIQRLEELVGVPVRWIGVGPGRDALIVKP